MYQSDSVFRSDTPLNHQIMRTSAKLKSGSKLYLPSNDGLALLCQVISFTDLDVLVNINGYKQFIPKHIVDMHGILIDQSKANLYVTQTIHDPSNRIVYLRHVYNETWIDKLYNKYCLAKKRLDQAIIEPK